MLASLFVFMFMFAAAGHAQAPTPPAPAAVPAPAPAAAPAPAPGAIIIQTIRQPPITREITMGDVVLEAVGFLGVVMIAAALAGVTIGVVIVMIKRSRDAVAGPTDPGHAKLRT